MRRRARGRRGSFGVALWVALSYTSPARADETTDQARVYFDAGAQAYSSGRYPVAIEAFADAYRLAPRPAILFSMAQAERKQFWIDKKPEGIGLAIKHYRAYLAEVPEGGRRDDAATALSELEPAAARLEVAPEGGPSSALHAAGARILVSSQAVNARASVDGEAPTLLPRLTELPAGKHHVSVTADGFYADARDVTVLAGATTPVEINLREQPGLLTVQAESGATVLLDGRPLGTLPSTRPFEVQSGPHELALSRNGRQLFHEEITLERGRSKTVIAPLLLSRQRRISEVVLAVGAVGLVTGGVFLAVAFGQQGVAGDVQAARQTGPISMSQLLRYNDALSARDQWRTASAATFGGGLAVLTAGGALFLFDHPTGDAARHGAEPSPAPPLLGPAGCGCSVEISALPTFAPGFGGAGVVGRF